MIEFINNNTLSIAKLSGIYAIINIKNSRFYIGESEDIQQRWKQHISNLKNNSHYNRELQNDFNHYGLDAFKLKIIQPHMSYNEIITKAELLIIENEYLQMYKGKYKLYNKSETLKDLLLDRCQINGGKEYPYMKDAVRKYVISILLKNDICFIDGMFYIVRCATLDDLTKYRSKRKRHAEKISKIPKNIINRYFKLYEVEYIERGEYKKQTIYKLINRDGFYEWLNNNDLSEYIDTIESNIMKPYFCF